jgi:N utilization substance protein B
MSEIEEEKILVSRHAARFIAVLSLYSFDMRKQDSLSKAAEDMLRSYYNKDIFYFNVKDEIELHAPDELFLNQLIDLVEKKQESIDQLIRSNLIEKYSFNKLDRVIKAILRLAAAELLYYGDVPAKVVIDEYVSITKAFYESSEAGFINKVVDILARSVRPEEVN